jgi:outer membrane protein assembly factor BamB
VHCINLRDGTPVWKKRQMDGDLFLAGVWQGKVIVVGRSSIRALHLNNGEIAWYLPTGEMPSGQGVAARNVYYLPLKKGEILAVDIAKGQVKAHNKAKNDNVSLGNLVFFEGAVIAQTPREIVAYPQLLAKLDEINVALRDDPNNSERLVSRGELLLADGQVSKAVDDLHLALDKKPAPALVSRAKNALYEALTQMLQSDFNAAAPEFLDEYRTLCRVPGDEKEEQQRQARYFRIVAQGREAQGNLVEAFQMYREFGSLPIHREQGGIAVLDDPMHKVPVDVWLRGRVSAMFARATPQERDPLSRKIVEEWRAVEAKKDPNAIRSFVGMFDVAFPVGREARLRLAESIIERNDRTAFLEAELSLHQLRSAAFRRDAESGGRALAALALLEEKKGTVESMKQAAAYYRELAAAFPDAVVRDNKTGRKLLDELATDKRFLPFLAEPTGLWSEEKIGARELQSGHGLAALQGFSFQPEGELTPSMKRHRLILDPNNLANPVVRFVDLTTGDTRWTSQLGATPANLQLFTLVYNQKQNINANINVNVRILGARGVPASRVYDPDHRYRFYQVKGHMIVLQVGTQVYCLDAGNGKILWQHPLIDPPAQGVNQPMFANQVLPDEDGRLELIMINQFNGQRTRLPVGGVGAVQASYAALLTQKGLVVLDPLRGTTLWKKMDVPASTHVFGDDQHLFLVDAAEGDIGAGRVFRASDGAFIDAADFGPVYANRIRVVGSRILAANQGKEQTTLRLYDIVSGKDLWTKPFKGKMAVLRTEDPSLTGVIDTETGALTVLDAATGKQLMAGQVNQYRITQDDLRNLDDPLLLADRERFYVMLNQPVDTNKVAGGILFNNFNNGLRCLPVNGWVAAFHRHDGKHRADGAMEAHKAGDMAWHSSKPLENQMVVLEQFDLLPVLIFSTRYNEMIAGGARGNRWLLLTQSIHKATGKSIYDSGQRTTANGQAQFESLSLDLQAGTINLLSFTNTVQHYIDDGRKVELPPGATAATRPPRPPNIAVDMLVPPGAALPVQIQRVAPIQRIPIRVDVKPAQK